MMRMLTELKHAKCLEEFLLPIVILRVMRTHHIVSKGF